MQFLHGFIVTCHNDENIRFYQPSDYGLAKTLDTGIMKIDGFSETNDQSLLATGNTDGFLRIFQFDGFRYSQVQEIYVGFLIKFVYITSERLALTGVGGKI